MLFIDFYINLLTLEVQAIIIIKEQCTPMFSVFYMFIRCVQIRNTPIIRHAVHEAVLINNFVDAYHLLKFKSSYSVRFVHCHYTPHEEILMNDILKQVIYYILQLYNTYTRLSKVCQSVIYIYILLKTKIFQRIVKR